MTDAGTTHSQKIPNFSNLLLNGASPSKELRPLKKILKGSFPDSVSKQRAQLFEKQPSFEGFGSPKPQKNDSMTTNSPYLIQGKALQFRINEEFGNFHAKEKNSNRISSITRRSPQQETRKLTQLYIGSVNNTSNLSELTPGTQAQLPKNLQSVCEMAGSGNSNSQVQEVKVEEKTHDLLQSPPRLAYTKSIGTRDRARKDLLDFIREKKVRDSQLQGSSSDNHLSNNLTASQSKVEQDNQDVKEDLNPPPSIVYTNSIGYKSRAQQDILDYIKEKKQKMSGSGSKIQEETTKTEIKKARNELFAFIQEKNAKQPQDDSQPTIDDNNQGNQGSPPPQITYTNTYGSKRKAREDIIAFVREKKASHQLGGSDTPDQSPMNVINEQVTFSPKLNASAFHYDTPKRKLGEVGKSRSVERQLSENLDLTLIGSAANYTKQRDNNLRSLKSSKSLVLPPLRNNNFSQQRSLFAEKDLSQANLEGLKKKIELNSPQTKPKKLPSIISPFRTPQIKKSNRMFAREDGESSAVLSKLLASNSSQDELIEIKVPQSTKINRHYRHASALEERQVQRIGNLSITPLKFVSPLDTKRKVVGHASFEMFDNMILRDKSLDAKSNNQNSFQEQTTINQRRRPINSHSVGTLKAKNVNAALAAEHLKEVATNQTLRDLDSSTKQEIKMPFEVEEPESNDKKSRNHLDFTPQKSNFEKNNHIRLKLKQQSRNALCSNVNMAFSTQNHSQFKPLHGNNSKVQPVKIVQHIFSVPIDGSEK